jgi:hypothetical protein
LGNFNTYIIIFLSFLYFGCSPELVNKEVKIAFMADIHFADVYPELEYLAVDGIPTTEEGKPILIRTMEAQLHSTRLFNENYVAFKAAVEDAVKRGIKIIAMPGDFSDDGQSINIKGLQKLMNYYTREYGVLFFMINGNHDPTHPFGKEGGESDFLGANGKAQPIMSKTGMYTAEVEKENKTIVIKEIAEWGYEGIVNELSEFGFFPNENYVYWETPFSKYTYHEYNYNIAKEASNLEKRTYFFDETNIEIPDVSYLVEPTEGIWLLGLDANVYIPKADGKEFHGTGIGYNEVLEHKKYLLDWTRKVVKEANQLGKTLIAFSHYPMVDFNDGASDELRQLFGENSFQAHRIPSKLVGETFADLGLKVHVGGHMHLNDTGILTTSKGNSLTNIQTPSLAAYKPGYKVITVNNNANLNVETILLDSVPEFNSFFKLYRQEHEFLKSNFKDRMWDETILSSKTYKEFTNIHLKELVHWRFLVNDWPISLKEILVGKTGWQLLQYTYGVKYRKEEFKSSVFTETELQKHLANAGLSKSDFKNWSGEDLILDFYRFRSADKLALLDIDSNQLKAYVFLFKLLAHQKRNEALLPLQQFASIFQKQMNGEESVNFEVILK